MSNVDTTTEEGRILREQGRKWLGRVEKALDAEKGWRDDAGKAVKAYTGETSTGTMSAVEQGDTYDFNILHSNVETIVPAVINSTPAPDIRRRFGGDDPVARDFAELLERAIRVQVDDGRLQTELEAMAQDGFLAGRGIIRLRFKADEVGGETSRAELDERERADVARDAEEDPIAEPDVENERICFEAVSWRDFARGPAQRWSDVPWMGFRHAMERDDMEAFSDRALIGTQGDDDLSDDTDDDRVVWEIWDRKTKTVWFVADRTGLVIKRVDDPLGLSKFFPIATPVQPIEVTGRLKPVNPFAIYRKLADELDETTKRIRAVTDQMRVKGWYATGQEELQALLNATDNEFIPLKDMEAWMQKGGIGGAIAFWPVEKLIVVLVQLYQMRDQTKAAIYEITGISDIVRGASNSQETATAQQIKTQWGSLRIQKFQRMMERAARDLFLMMAEVIPTKFSAQTLQQMTEVQVAPTEQEMQPTQMPQQPQPTGNPEQDQQTAQQFRQAQTQAQQTEQARMARLQHLEQLSALMQQRASTYYRIDVETDSTVRADLTRQKAEATGFMQAASQYFTAVAPLVQQGALPMNVAVEIFSSFSRMFNLGKTVEDALDELVTMAKQKAGQPPEPNPAEEAAKAESALKVEGMKADLEGKKLDGEIKKQAASDDRIVKDLEVQIRQTDLQLRKSDLALKTQQLLGGAAMPPARLPGIGGPYG